MQIRCTEKESLGLKKSLAVSENQPGENFSSLTCPHSRMRIRIYIFCFKKSTNRNEKQKKKLKKLAKQKKQRRKKMFLLLTIPVENLMGYDDIVLTICPVCF